jgi:peroxiredoxin
MGDVARAFVALDEGSFRQIQVGKPAINFELFDARGRKWRLADSKGKTVVLIWIFADWCPVCHGEFHELIELRDQFASENVEVVTVECHDRFRARVMVGEELSPLYWFSKESPQEAYRDKIWWRHLSDPAGAVGAQYGVDPMAFVVHSEWINRPSTIIIDTSGMVRFSYYGTYWGDRPSIRQTLEMVSTGLYEFRHPKRLELLER